MRDGHIDQMILTLDTLLMRISYTANITYTLVRLNLKNIRTHSYQSEPIRINP